MTGAAIATIKYSTESGGTMAQAMAIALSAISSITVTALFVSTIVHAFVLGDLFPNDVSIAIADKQPRLGKRRINLICGTPEAKEVED